MTKEEILGGVFDYTTWLNKSPDLLNGVRKAMDQYAAQQLEEYKAAADKNLEQVLHLGTLATDQQAEIERLKGLLKKELHNKVIGEGFHEIAFTVRWLEYSRLNNL